MPDTRSRSAGRSLLATALVAVATAVTYFVTLGWDTEYDVAPDGSQSGPWSFWQVLILILVLTFVVAYAAWRRHPVVGASVTTFVLTVCWSSWAADDDSGLWVIGAILLIFGAGFCFTLVALAASAIGSTRRREIEAQVPGTHAKV